MELEELGTWIKLKLDVMIAILGNCDPSTRLGREVPLSLHCPQRALPAEEEFIYINGPQNLKERKKQPASSSEFMIDIINKW